MLDLELQEKLKSTIYSEKCSLTLMLIVKVTTFNGDT